VPILLRNQHRVLAYYCFFLAAECSFSILYEFSAIRGLALQIDDGFLTLLQSMLCTH